LTGSPRVEESLRIVADFSPGIVIVDAQTGEGAGIEVLRKLKSLDVAPVVIMTASSPYQQYRQECLKSGADFYFELPAEIEQLSTVVMDLTDRSSIDDG